MAAPGATLLAALLLAIAAPVGAEPPESIPTLALDVANPRRTGRRILHFEDLIGPRARPLAQPTKALLIVMLAPGTQQPRGASLDAIAEASSALVAAGGMVVAVVMPGATTPDDPPLDPEAQPFVVVRDTYGLAKRRLGLLGPGHALVVRSDGRIAGVFVPEALSAAVRSASALLKEEQ